MAKAMPQMLISGWETDLCLSYVNTLSWRGSPAPSESLHDVVSLLAWLKRFAGANARVIEDANGWSRTHPGKAARLFEDAIQVREALHSVISAVATGETANQPDFALFQRALSAAPARRRLISSANGFAWQIEQVRMTAPHLLAAILWSAADLLLGDAQHCIRRCANSDCLWLFIDRSKAGKRRWCDMGSCGNRAKARRHYLRTKLAQP